MEAALSIEKIEQVKMIMVEALEKIQNAPGAPRRKPLLNPNQPAHPAMLLLANPDGSLRSEFQDWAEDQTFELNGGTLLPTWWPYEHLEDGDSLSHEERVGIFHDELENLLSFSRERGVTPNDVLKALIFLRDLYAPSPNLAQD
jgi:hypothetical protein